MISCTISYMIFTDCTIKHHTSWHTERHVWTHPNIQQALNPSSRHTYNGCKPDTWPTCQLNNSLPHVIHIQFDDTSRLMMPSSSLRFSSPRSSSNVSGYIALEGMGQKTVRKGFKKTGNTTNRKTRLPCYCRDWISWILLCRGGSLGGNPFTVKKACFTTLGTGARRVQSKQTNSQAMEVQVRTNKEEQSSFQLICYHQEFVTQTCYANSLGSNLYPLRDTCGLSTMFIFGYFFSISCPAATPGCMITLTHKLTFWWLVADVVVQNNPM